MTAALLRLIQTIVFGTLSKAIDLICILALFVLGECYFVLDWYANMFAAIGEIVLRCNADSVAARARMQRTEWLSRHVHRLAGHLLDAFLLFLILCFIVMILASITRAVLSRMDADIDDGRMADDRTIAEDAEAHDTETHDPKVHGTETRDTEPPATKSNDSDVKTTTIKAASIPIKNAEDQPSATPPPTHSTRIRDLQHQNANLHQENTGLEVVFQKKNKGAESFRSHRPALKTDLRPPYLSNHASRVIFPKGMYGGRPLGQEGKVSKKVARVATIEEEGEGKGDWDSEALSDEDVRKSLNSLL